MDSCIYLLFAFVALWCFFFSFITALALFKKTLAKKTSALDSPDICTFTAPSN